MAIIDKTATPEGRPKSIEISDDATLLFILNSGISGRLSAGRVERDGGSVINVYDRHGKLQPYFSGAQLRSWCVVGADWQPISSWSAVLPEDQDRILPNMRSTI
jgi:hypothetical protein